jgi:hypothetical protein
MTIRARLLLATLSVSLPLIVGGCHKGGTTVHSDLGADDLSSGGELPSDTSGFAVDDGGVLNADAFVDSVTAAGDVQDFEDGSAVSGTVSISVLDLVPSPTVSVTGTMFTLSNVQPFSVFGLLVSATPGYHPTYNPLIRIDGTPLTGIKAFVMRDSYLTGLSTAFSHTPKAGAGTVFARMVDAKGNALSGIDATALQVGGAAPPVAAKVLDSNKMAMAGATVTSASGYVVLYDVPPGVLALSATAASKLTLATPAATVGADSETVVDIVVTMGAVTLPTNVSFTRDVDPIFFSRGCVNCHSAGGIGRALGGLTLDGNKQTVWKALTQDISPNFNTTRVNLAMPDKSLLLTMPGYENPPDKHPIVVFATTTDPDYLKILSWIKAGAKYDGPGGGNQQ